MELVLDGQAIHSEVDFHQRIGALLEMTAHYGSNLDALWDRLSTDIERPITLVWKNSGESRRFLGAAFDRIVGVFERVRRQDEEWGLQDRFDYRLE